MDIFSKSIAFTVVLTSFLNAQNTLPRDSDGWTIFTPHENTRIHYVSSSTGDDGSAQAYTPASAEIGNNPFLPSGEVKAFKTIAAAYESSRDGQPDWILLKRGDIWYESLQRRSGLSDGAPFLVASYGTGADRPFLKTGAESAISYCCKNFNNAAFSDIDFYAHTRNPDSDEYEGPQGGSGISVYVGDEFTGTGLLIEGCRFRFYANNVIQGPGTLNDLVLRRCVILDNYSTTAHSQGLYTNNVSITLEENVFDHNGWYKQQIGGGNEKEEGQATMFNHNTYFSHSHDVTFRGNIFLRPSSIGNKWTANSGEASASNITIDNNLYIDGEIGISMGGNETEPPYRFKNIAVTNNVMLDMGLSRPTNRTLGWYLEMNDWDEGLVSGNYFLHKTNPEVGNVYGVQLNGETRNVSIDNNMFYGLNTGGKLLGLSDGITKDNISISNNTFHNENENGTLVRADGSIQNYAFSGNRYFSSQNESEWFRIESEHCDFSTWTDRSGETVFTGEESYADPDRRIQTYMDRLGKTPTFSAFIEEVRQQCRSNWREEFTAARINEWIKAGFSTEATGLKRPEQITEKFFDHHNANRYGVYNLNGRLMGTIENRGELRRFSKSVVILKPLLGSHDFIGSRTLLLMSR